MKRIVLPIMVALLLVGITGCQQKQVVKVEPPVETTPVETKAIETKTEKVIDKPVVETKVEKKPDTLAGIKARGVMVVGVRETAPPFGTVNPKTNKNEGYDIDFARYIANKLGVNVEFRPVTASSRIPMLMDGRVDMLAAAMTKNAERAKQIDFSYTYFRTGQKFLAEKKKFKTLKDFEGKKIGTSRGSAAEQVLATVVPTAVIVSFDDYPKAITGLRQKKVEAVTTDEAILAGQLFLLEKSGATTGKFEIPDIRISTALYGFGIRKGDAEFMKFINNTLLEMERNGEAKNIFTRWFGPKSECPISRIGFAIAEPASPEE